MLLANVMQAFYFLKYGLLGKIRLKVSNEISIMEFHW